MSLLPCQNPNCKSYGRPHPNCRCHGGMAHGGQVLNYCDSKNAHHPSCEFHVEQYAHGGNVEDHGHTYDHAANSHGLLGILKKTGKVHGSFDIDKHNKHLEKVKGHMVEGRHEKAQSMLDDHLLMGGVGKSHKDKIMGRMSGPLSQLDPHSESFKSSVDYLNHSAKGMDAVSDHAGKLFDKSNDTIKPEGIEDLKKHIDELQADPSKLLEVGGSIGHYLPEDSAQIGAQTAIALNYLSSLKPKQTQHSPFDTIAPPDKMQTSIYNRQLEISQHPMLILQHAKHGTLHPQDLVTVSTIYPKLINSIKEKVSEQIIKAKSDGKEIPYKQSLGLSQILGQPLDSTMTPMAAQAVMSSAGPQQMQQQAKKEQKSPSGAVISQINKVDKLYETPLEARSINKLK